MDLVIPENEWAQKERDIRDHEVDIFVMGDDWTGKFNELQELCQVVYLPRTEGVSSTEIKQMLRVLDPKHLEEMQDALSSMGRLLSHYRDLT